MRKDGYGEEEEASLGGQITLPRNFDPRRWALSKRISLMDVACLGDVHYHGGVDGYYPLTESIIHNCKYTEFNTNDVILSYNAIIHVHTYVMDTWEHPKSYHKGHQVDQIVEKGFSSFSRLKRLTVEEAVEFYDNFHKTLMLYLLPVMPFDCITIKMGFEALCLPGLGLPCYAQIARALMEILPCLLPRGDTQVTSLVNVTRMASNNGYDLLWRVLYLREPGFNPVKPVHIPLWQDKDIFEFALSFSLYYCLEAKKGNFHDNRTRSTTFLNAIQDPGYTDVVTTLMTHIHNYYAKDDNGFLPTNLCTMGLASQLHTSAQKRASTVVPWVRCALGIDNDWEFDVPTQGSPRVACTDGSPPCRGYDRLPPRGGRGRFPPREDRGSFEPKGAHPFQSRPYVQSGRDGVQP
jgi:hypothetical protein